MNDILPPRSRPHAEREEQAMVNTKEFIFNQ
jgi:hypothetical protein